MSGIYNTDGTIALTKVTGSVLTGLQAADGSINVVVDDAVNFGLYHPCGAYRLNSGSGVTLQDASGAFFKNHILGPGSSSVLA